jgi:hypothetical protein
LLVALFAVSCGGGKSPSLVTLESIGVGKIDTWLYFDNAGHLLRFAKDKNGDGKADWIDDYRFDKSLNRERLIVSHVDLDGDGRFETTAYPAATGHAVRIVRDRNGDGKPDLIAFYDYDHPERNRISRDDNFDGVFEQTGSNLSMQ